MNTYIQVVLFVRRVFAGHNSQKIFCLINADALKHDQAKIAEKNIQNSLDDDKGKH